MRLIVDLCQMLEIKVGVDLRRRDVRVAKEFLHGVMPRYEEPSLAGGRPLHEELAGFPRQQLGL